MGLFDTLLIDEDLIQEYDIRCPTCNELAIPYRVLDWQTKDLDCDMSVYQMYYQDGYRLRFVENLWADDKNENVEDNFFPQDLHGRYEVYTKCHCSRDKAYPDGSILIELKFTDGLLVDVKKRSDFCLKA